MPPTHTHAYIYTFNLIKKKNMINRFYILFALLASSLLVCIVNDNRYINAIIISATFFVGIVAMTYLLDKDDTYYTDNEKKFVRHLKNSKFWTD